MTNVVSETGYGAIFVANGVLQNFFEYGSVALTPMKLQRAVYFTAADYAYSTGRKLVGEDFKVWAYGPVLESINDQYSCFNDKFITNYSKCANGVGYIINGDDAFFESVSKVCRSTRNLTSQQLSRISQLEGSAWDMAYQRKDSVISFEDMKVDETYRKVLF